MPIQVRVKLYLDPDQDDPGGKKNYERQILFYKNFL